MFLFSLCLDTVSASDDAFFLKSQDNGASFVRGPASKGDHFGSEPVPQQPAQNVKFCQGHWQQGSSSRKSSA